MPKEYFLNPDANPYCPYTSHDEKDTKSEVLYDLPIMQPKPYDEHFRIMKNKCQCESCKGYKVRFSDPIYVKEVRRRMVAKAAHHMETGMFNFWMQLRDFMPDLSCDIYMQYVP